MSNSILNEIYKPSADQSTLDEVASVILAYGMTAVFLVRNKGTKLLPSHLFRLYSYIEKGKNTISFNSMETASSTHDQISLHCPMSEKARSYILNSLVDRDSANFCMVRSIIDYLNNDNEFNAIVAQTTNNGVLNRINIDVDNVSPEGNHPTTVLIDNTHVSVFNTVLPIYDFRTGIGGIGQKDLKNDYGYDSHRRFIISSLGVDIGPDSALYYQAAHNNGNPTVESMEHATRNLYKDVCRRITDGLEGSYDSILHDFKQTMINSMLGCCYGVNSEDDCTCLIMPSGKVTHESFNAKDLASRLYHTELSAVCPDNVNPSIRIMNGSKELFQLRLKKERYKDNITGHRYKLYFKPSRVKEYFEY